MKKNNASSSERPLVLSHIYTKMGKTSCCVPGCENTNKTVNDRPDKVLFHQFPNRVFDFTRFVAWSNFAKMSAVSTADRICSDHFLPSDYSDTANSLSSKILPQSYLGHHFNPRLKRTAVPSVCPPQDNSDSDCLQLEVSEDHGGPRKRRDVDSSSLMWYWTDQSVVYVDMHGFGYKMLKQGIRHMYFACSQTADCSGKTMTTKRYKNPRMLSGHTHETEPIHLHYARCWQTFKRFTKEHYTMEKHAIRQRFKLKYPQFQEALNNLHIESSMDRWISDVHNVRPRSPDDYASEDISTGELSDSESIPPTTTTVNIFHNPGSVYAKCSVPSCTSYFDKSRPEYAGKKYYYFPDDPETRTLWIKAIGKPDDWDPKDSLVCSSHFMKSSFQPSINNVSSSRKALQEGAVPSMNLDKSVISDTSLDPLAEGNAEEVDGEIYEVTSDEFIYAPMKTVDIPSKGDDDSPLSIPVVKVDKYFLQRAKEKALANLVSGENDAVSALKCTSPAESKPSPEILEAQDLEEGVIYELIDENEESEEGVEMQSLMEQSVSMLSSILHQKKDSSANGRNQSFSALPEKKRLLSNHEILKNADSLLRNRFKSKSTFLLSRPKGVKPVMKIGEKQVEKSGRKQPEKSGVKQAEKSGGKQAEKSGGKQAENTGGKQAENTGGKQAEKTGGKRAPPRRLAQKPEVKSPVPQKRKRLCGEELIDLEDQKEWTPSKWTVAKWTKAGVIPAEAAKKRPRKGSKKSESEAEVDDEDEEAGYTIVEPLNITVNLNNGIETEEANDIQEDVIMGDETAQKEVPPFMKRSSGVTNKNKKSITIDPSNDSSSEIELIQESSSEKRTHHSKSPDKGAEIKEEADEIDIAACTDTHSAVSGTLAAKEEDLEEDELAAKIVHKEISSPGKRKRPEDRAKAVEDATKPKSRSKPTESTSERRPPADMVENRDNNITPSPTPLTDITGRLHENYSRGQAMLRSLRNLIKDDRYLSNICSELDHWYITNKVFIDDLAQITANSAPSCSNHVTNPPSASTDFTDARSLKNTTQQQNHCTDISPTSNVVEDPSSSSRTASTSSSTVPKKLSLKMGTNVGMSFDTGECSLLDELFSDASSSETKNKKSNTRRKRVFRMDCPVCGRNNTARSKTMCTKCEYVRRKINETSRHRTAQDKIINRRRNRLKSRSSGRARPSSFRIVCPVCGENNQARYNSMCVKCEYARRKARKTRTSQVVEDTSTNCQTSSASSSTGPIPKELSFKTNSDTGAIVDLTECSLPDELFPSVSATEIIDEKPGLSLDSGECSLSDELLSEQSASETTNMKSKNCRSRFKIDCPVCGQNNFARSSTICTKCEYVRRNIQRATARHRTAKKNNIRRRNRLKSWSNATMRPSDTGTIVELTKCSLPDELFPLVSASEIIDEKPGLSLDLGKCLLPDELLSEQSASETTNMKSKNCRSRFKIDCPVCGQYNFARSATICSKCEYVRRKIRNRTKKKNKRRRNRLKSRSNATMQPSDSLPDERFPLESRSETTGVKSDQRRRDGRFQIECPICCRNAIARSERVCLKCEYIRRKARTQTVEHLTNCDDGRTSPNLDCPACLLNRMNLPHAESTRRSSRIEEGRNVRPQPPY